MNLNNLMSTSYLAVLAIGGIAALASAVMSIAKKKTAAPLAIYGLCVALLLGGGYFMSDINPVPNERHVKAEKTQPQDSKRAYMSEYTPLIRQADEPEPELPQTDLSASVEEDAVEPELEQQAVEPENTPEPVQSQSKPKSSAKRASSSGLTAQPQPEKEQESKPDGKSEPEQEQSTVPEWWLPSTMPVSTVRTTPPASQQPSFSLSENPTLAPEPTLDAMDGGPQLIPEPTYDAAGNIVPTNDPEPASSQNFSQSNTASSGVGGSPEMPTNTFRDGSFANGNVLITIASDNNNDPVYHTGECQAAQKIAKEDRVWFNSRREAEDDNRRICGYCDR